MLWTASGSRFRRGDLPIPGRGSASSCRAGRRRRSRRSSADASQVNALTGASPTVALHVLWDLPGGKADVPAIQGLEKKYGVKAGSINPNLFQDAEYKYGSIANPSAEIRGNALAHLLDSVEIGRELGSKDVSLWIADGSNYPGTQSIRKRIGWMEEVLAATHAALGEDQRMLVEYKPFEPAFYHTDIADWGMALELARRAGPKAKVLVDTGHHYQGTNIEQIVAWLLRLGELGGFHFNDRKYADDDLTLGSIDPYQVFRIFHEILSVAEEERAGDRVHDRPEPQPEGQDGGDGADRGDGAGAVMRRRRWSIRRSLPSCSRSAGWWRRRSVSAGRSGRMCGRWCGSGGWRGGCRRSL